MAEWEKQVYHLDNPALFDWYLHGTNRHAALALPVIEHRKLSVPKRPQMDAVVSRAIGPLSGLAGRQKATKLLKDRAFFLLGTNEGKQAYEVMSDAKKTLLVTSNSDFVSSIPLLRQLQGAVASLEQDCGFSSVKASSPAPVKSACNAEKKARVKTGTSKPSGRSRTARRMGTGVAGVRAGSR